MHIHIHTHTCMQTSYVTMSMSMSMLQALGFGTSFYLIGRLISDGDGSGADQILPVTAVNIAMVAAFSGVWALLDGCGIGPLAASASAGWLLDEPSREAFALPGALFGDNGAGPSAMLTPQHYNCIILHRLYHSLIVVLLSRPFSSRPVSASL